MKPSKEQPPLPGAQQRIQGVDLQFSSEHATASALVTRVAKVTSLIENALANNRLSPTEAATLAGKCGHLSTTTFGKIGRAAVKPILARRRGQVTHRNRLNHGLRSAMLVIRLKVGKGQTSQSFKIVFR